jgi:hypothetical protein
LSDFAQEILGAVDNKMSSMRRSAAIRIVGAANEAVANVMDAHLEMLSMFVLTTCWAIGYGWVEGSVSIGHILATNPNMIWFQFLGQRFSIYHFFLGFTIFVISFSFGFLKFTRMLYHRKRYMAFTALGNYAYAMVAQDWAYFFFAPYDPGINAESWTCSGLGLGCFLLKNPTAPDLVYFLPRWYIVGFLVAGVMFFLAYRSALVNLLVTREVMKQIGYVEKTALPMQSRVPELPRAHPSPAKDSGAKRAGRKEDHVETPVPPTVDKAVEGRRESPPEVKAKQIVDTDREELMKRLRERLARQGP